MGDKKIIMIYYSTAWDDNKNIGVYYNNFMELLPSSSDFACFVDGDAMFLTTNFGKQLSEIVNRHPDKEFFTCLTNRVGCPFQIADGCPEGDDILAHKNFATRLQDRFYYDIVDIDKHKLPHYPTGYISGHLMLIRKSMWEKLGGFLRQGILQVDNHFHKKAITQEERIYLMQGVYIYHWYRGGGARSTGDTRHLL